jgi:hypothetical protein
VERKGFPGVPPEAGGCLRTCRVLCRRWWPRVWHGMWPCWCSVTRHAVLRLHSGGHFFGRGGWSGGTTGDRADVWGDLRAHWCRFALARHRHGAGPDGSRDGFGDGGDHAAGWGTPVVTEAAVSGLLAISLEPSRPTAFSRTASSTPGRTASKRHWPPDTRPRGSPRPSAATSPATRPPRSRSATTWRPAYS